MYNKPKLWRNCGQSINSLRHPLFHELLPVPAQEKRDFIKKHTTPFIFIQDFRKCDFHCHYQLSNAIIKQISVISDSINMSITGA